MNAITMIQNEHARIAAVLHALEHLADDLVRVQGQPDLSPFEAILHYLESFPARFHHPKEEQYLFVALADAVPELRPVLDRLREQHDDGERRLVELSRALERLRAEPVTGIDAFRRTVADYAAAEREHMRLEEREVLPAALALGAAELARLEEAFKGHIDPLFGPKRQQRYRDLYSHILAVTPAPHGLADPWAIGRPAGAAGRVAHGR